MTDTSPHEIGNRVRSIFDDEREGVVIKSNSQTTLIEFEDNDNGVSFTHRKWLPTRHWESAHLAQQESTHDR